MMTSSILNPLDFIPRIPIGNWVDSIIQTLRTAIGPLTRVISTILSGFMGVFSDLLLMIPAFFLIIIISAIAWKLASQRVAVFSFLGLSLIYNIGLWEEAIITVTMILVAVFISLLIGLPTGILSTRYEMVHKIVWPVLDFMQTMPAFVYLIPAIFFFRLGVVSAMIATVVFSVPPVIRLTGLGIRLVPEDMVEAATAFGTTDWQKLTKVQLPLAMPTIMAGVNQCIMLALSMVVIAAMIGAGGLGAVVLRGIQRVDLGLGFEGGVSVVILAIILDRITQRTKDANE
ncbi:glycine betaine/proline transport system permease protein [Tindallia magadiensis]|uniref:Glycine betaine/proline transport system permease protein n=1 Tax=Tindallia magadiensis TaxID=69895 RepID=A0A1I3C1P7_9FIRM|nr:proline/glycine betaine ABC transporter permease [Tindallia magadiensis]SFH68129.1 glycine betaine/proline transport system permease protein [Tindallia magadiensis]